MHIIEESYLQTFSHSLELHYGWAQPTLHTYLTRLVKKGILHSEGKGYKCKRSYYPELTEQELAHKYATDFVDNTFNGSISDLLVSLMYNTCLLYTSDAADE